MSRTRSFWSPISISSSCLRTPRIFSRSHRKVNRNTLGRRHRRGPPPMVHIRRGKLLARARRGRRTSRLPRRRGGRLSRNIDTVAPQGHSSAPPAMPAGLSRRSLTFLHAFFFFVPNRSGSIASETRDRVYSAGALRRHRTISLANKEPLIS